MLTADRDSNEVSIIDTASHTRLATVPVGERPFGVTIDADGRRAYTANVGSDDVSVIDIAARRVVGTVKVGRRPYADGAGGAGRSSPTSTPARSPFSMWTGSTVVKTLEVGDHPEGIAADASGSVYVALWGDDELVKIDAVKLEVVARTGVGAGPRAFGEFLR